MLHQLGQLEQPRQLEQGVVREVVCELEGGAVEVLPERARFGINDRGGSAGVSAVMGGDWLMVLPNG
ncbi:hypothetical protein [Frigoriglobus tundricola]|uniref:hypothetical protein n=1 Tax=Frigoriglobus tundricola TaxID=2774151 RepID=UPI00148EE107|nr:hypothetical protein [Frigoriglobus tundricola]